MKRVIFSTIMALGAISLNDASIIVAGGRAVKSAEGFAPLRELAEVLGAAIGASRSYLMPPAISKMGRYMAINMPPTPPPRNIRIINRARPSRPAWYS